MGTWQFVKSLFQVTSSPHISICSRHILGKRRRGAFNFFEETMGHAISPYPQATTAQKGGNAHE